MFFFQDPVEFQCPVSEETVFTTDELQEFLSLFQSPTESTDELQELLSLFQSGASVGPNTVFEGSNQAVYADDERKKLRRLESTRESARRSRLRKKRHLQNLTDQVNQLKMENQELKNRLGLALHQSHVILVDNQRLRSESIALSARLLDLYRILFTMQ